MTKKQNLKRPKQKIVRFNETELDYLNKKIKDSPFNNFQNFARILLLTGEVKIVDYSSLQQLNGEVNRIGNNINQIARGINEAALKDNIDAELINDVKMQMDQLRGLEEALIETNKRFYRAAKKTVVEIKENFQEEI